MASKLKRLFAEFSKEFGYVGPDGKLTSEFLADRHALIIEGLKDFEAGNFFEAFGIVNSRCSDIDLNFFNDPIVGLLILRSGDEVFRVGIDKAVPERNRAAFRAMFSVCWFNDWSGHIHQAIFQQIRALADPATLVPQVSQRFDDSLKYLLQYGRFRRLGFEIKGGWKKTGEASTDFRRGGLARFSDYTNVHPFLTELCPPQHIWPKFISDGDFCEVQQDGSLKRTPLEHCDPAKIAEPQKHFPFLHVLNDTETYPPNKL